MNKSVRVLALGFALSAPLVLLSQGSASAGVIDCVNTVPNFVLHNPYPPLPISVIPLNLTHPRDFTVHSVDSAVGLENCIVGG